MSVFTAALRELMAAGLQGEQLIAAMERIDEAATPQRSPGAKRTAAWRERKDASQNVTCDASDAPPSPSPSSSSPTPPLITTPSPDPQSSLRSESVKGDWPKDAFEQFWKAYPRRVAKKAAQRRFDLVRRAPEVAFAVLLDAVGRIDVADPKFIPHPATWLHEGRYLDGEIATTGPPAALPPGMTPERLEWIREQQRKQSNGEHHRNEPTLV